MRHLMIPVLSLIVSSLVSLSPAHAQAARTWLSATGTGADCTRTSPCSTLSAAVPKTSPGGEVNCLDEGSYGNATVSAAITINCASNFNTITVNAGANDVVILRGLDIWLGGNSAGVIFNSGAGLVIENAVIHGFNSTNYLGINFQPSTVATLNVINSVITNNGNASSGGGIRIAPQSGGFARASLRNVDVSKNFVGVAAIGNGANASVEILNSTISHNRSVGLVAVGSGAVIRIGSSQVVGNADAATSGNVLSYGNNQIAGNNPDTFPASTGGLR